MKLGSNIRLREDGRYEARYFKGKSARGNAQYGSVYGATPEEADRNRTERLKELQDAGIQARPCTRDSAARRAKNPEVLDDKAIQSLEAIFAVDHDGAAFGFSLCLHMGISYGEICALKYSDFDFNKNTLTVGRKMSTLQKTRGEILICPERKLPIPKMVRDDYNKADRNLDCYILTDTEIPVPSVKSTASLFKKVVGTEPKLKKIDPESLQATFIKFAMESGLSGESVEAITGVSTRTVERRFKQYIKPDVSAVSYVTEKYRNIPTENRSMNLLILGAGSHGHAVMDLAETIGIFNKISFLDDHVTGSDVVGKLNDYVRCLDIYPCAFVALGNNELRQKYIEALSKFGYILPRLIHPDATILSSCEIGDATIIMAQATVNADHVGRGVIIAANAMMSFNSTAEDYSHIDCSSVITRGAIIKTLQYVESGAVIKPENEPTE